MNNSRNKIRSLLIIFAGLFLLLIISDQAHAGSAHLTWTANGEPDLDGYKIYYGTSSHSGTCPTGYANSQDVTDESAVSYWFDNLTPGQTYYFQLTAYDNASPANESTCSTSPGEVLKTITYRGDINGTPDHYVNISDLSILAGDYGKTSWCGPAHATDINRDCTVGISDLSIMAGEYGSHF